MGGSVKDLQSKEELDKVVVSGAPVVLHFWASWCEASKQMDQVFSQLSTDFPHAHFFRVEAEEQPEISEAYSVSAVPYFLFFKKDIDIHMRDFMTYMKKKKTALLSHPKRSLQVEREGKTLDTLEGANPSSLAYKVAKAAGSIDAVKSAAPASLGMAAGPTVLQAVKEHFEEKDPSKTDELPSAVLGDPLKMPLQKLVESHPVMLFMKGSPEQPRCGFSRKVVDILKKEGVEFGTFDILTDNEVREGLKRFSNWPTFPQLFCKGELLGGSDIAIAMHESGELKEVFTDHGVLPNVTKKEREMELEKDSLSRKGGVSNSPGLSTALTSRLETLVNSSPVMLFMKGKPEEPKCGFSSKVVAILREENISFDSFNILEDDEVRQGLKVFSNWSSFPQLYIKGELIGGSDIVLEMQKSGELKRVVAEKGVTKEETLEDRLKKLISSSPTMLFMKGTPDAPRCGFSSKVVNALREEGVEFGSFDILTNEEVRQGLKDFSNWPTFPQLYHNGDLIGGCDIVLELKSNGELKSTLSE